MRQRTTLTELNATIATLQLRQHAEWELLKEDIRTARKKLTPGYIMSHVVDGIGEAGLGKKIGLAAVGLTAGVAVKKIIAGSGANPVRKALGNVAEAAVSTNFGQYVSDAKTLGGILFKKLFKKKKKDADSKIL